MKQKNIKTKRTKYGHAKNTQFKEPSTKCVRRLHFNGINVKITNITLEASSNATFAEKESGRKRPYSTRAPQRC